MSDISDYFLECYSDAAFANLSRAGTQGAIIIMLENSKSSEGNRVNPCRRYSNIFDGSETAVYLVSMIA